MNTRIVSCWLMAVAAVVGVGTPSLAGDKLAADFPARSLSLQKADLHAAVSELAKSAGQAVVLLRIGTENAVYGTIVRGDGLVVTKGSELSQPSVVAVLPDGREVAGRVVANDDEEDLALVQLDAKDLQTVTWAKGAAKLGHWAVTPGRGGGVRSVGAVSAPARTIARRRLVLGFFASPDEGGEGVRVAEVVVGMGAEQAGLKAGDVISRVGGEPSAHIQDIAKALAAYREGQTVEVVVVRGDEEVTLEVELARHRPSPMSRTARMNRMGTDVSGRSDGFSQVIQHDSVLQPWECGGPLVNLDGEAIGLNIARAGRIASYTLPAELVQKRIDAMLSQSEQRLVVHREDAPATAPAH